MYCTSIIIYSLNCSCSLILCGYSEHGNMFPMYAPHRDPSTLCIYAPNREIFLPYVCTTQRSFYPCMYQTGRSFYPMYAPHRDPSTHVCTKQGDLSTLCMHQIEIYMYPIYVGGSSKNCTLMIFIFQSIKVGVAFCLCALIMQANIYVCTLTT